MRSVLHRLHMLALAAWVANPVRVVGAATYVVCLVAAKFGLALDVEQVAQAAAVLLPVLLGAEVARSRVSPYVGEIGEPSDARLQLPPDDQA